MGLHKDVQRVAVIGNGGGGKTTLSRRLSALHGLPLTHVDSIQFLPGLQRRPEPDTRTKLNAIAAGPAWLIDGFGPWDVMEARFRAADHIVFVDFPLWRHYWWCAKRQLQSLARPRSELPEGCDEATLAHTWKLAKILWRVHRQLRPKFIALFSEPELAPRVRHIRDLMAWNLLYTHGLRP